MTMKTSKVYNIESKPGSGYRNWKKKLIIYIQFNQILFQKTWMQLPLPLLAVQHPPSDAKIVVELLETEDVSNDTSFCKLLRACKNSPYFQNMVQLFNLMQIMLLAL